MKKIKNPRYRQFLDDGLIQNVTIGDLEAAFNNMRPTIKLAGKALVLALYYTGARPNEVLRLIGKNFQKEGHYLTIQVSGSKRGLPRKLFFPVKLPYIKDLWKYSKSLPENMLLFWQFKNEYIRKLIGKKGNKIERAETTDKVRYYFNIWFEGSITPYFMRHNRFSQLSEAGLNMQDLRMIKGSRTLESINYYIHLSSLSAKNAARKVR